jgi:CRP-like cAMP-binding protein
VPTDPEAIAREARDSALPWVRAAGRALDPSRPEVSPEEESMQRLLALKQVDLFSNLSLEQLDALHQATREAEYLPGEVIFREGEPGKELFLLLEGGVDIVKDHGGRDELVLSRLSAVDYFGEMAILVDEARSATAISTSHCRMLTLDGRSFKELILQIPEISFEIFRVLTARVRRAEARL